MGGFQRKNYTLLYASVYIRKVKQKVNSRKKMFFLQTFSFILFPESGAKKFGGFAQEILRNYDKAYEYHLKRPWIFRCFPRFCLK